jgi:hypothetical protein
MLRNKSNSYKRKRQEINDMTAELQLLKRTEELLKEQVEQIKSRMVINRLQNIGLITICFDRLIWRFDMKIIDFI